MKRETLFLKVAVIVIGFPVLALCILGLLWLVKNPVNPDYAHMLYPILPIFASLVITVFAAVLQKLLKNAIEKIHQ